MNKIIAIIVCIFFEILVYAGNNVGNLENHMSNHIGNIENLIVKNGNIELYTESIGDSTKPGILLIGGSMCSARFWTDDFCKDLANNGFFVIRYDNRDTGLSSYVDYNKDPYSLNDLAADAISILDAYKIQKAHIVGASMGGLIAQLLALDYADRVLSISVISSAVFNKPEFNQEEMAFLSSKIGPWISNKPTRIFEESIEGFVAAWQALHGDILLDKGIVENYMKDMYTRTKKEHLDWFTRLAQGLDPAHNHEVVLEKVENRLNDLKKVTLPFLVIHGEKDWLWPFRFVKENLISIIPHTQVYVITDMGHVVFNESLFHKIGVTINQFLQSTKK